jgi:hypothetical protein
MTARYECARRKSTNTGARIVTPRLNNRSQRMTEKVQFIKNVALHYANANGDSEGPQSRNDVYRLEITLVLP